MLASGERMGEDLMYVEMELNPLRPHEQQVSRRRWVTAAIYRPSSCWDSTYDPLGPGPEPICIEAWSGMFTGAQNRCRCGLIAF